MSHAHLPFSPTPPFKIWVLLLFGCGEANKSGSDCHGKDGLLPTDSGHAGPHREAPGSVRRPREGEGNCGQALLLWFPQEGPGEGGVSRLRSGQREPFQWVLGHQGCPSLSGTWSWMIRTGDRGLECRSPIKEAVGPVDSELVGLHWKEEHVPERVVYHL